MADYITLVGSNRLTAQEAELLIWMVETDEFDDVPNLRAKARRIVKKLEAALERQPSGRGVNLRPDGSAANA